MFYSVDKTEELNPDTASQIALRDCSVEARGRPGYMSFCNKDQVVRTSKESLLIKENQISQVKEFSSFSMYGKMQESGLTEIIPLICTSAIWGQYPVLSLPESPQG